MDADSNPAVDVRRRRTLLIAILAFPLVAALATWGAAGLGIIPGWVRLEAPPPAVVPATPPGLEVPGGLIVQPSGDPESLPGAASTVEAPPPRDPTGSVGDARPADGGTPNPGGTGSIQGGTGSVAPDPGPAGSGPPSPGGTVDEPPATVRSDDNDNDDERDDDDFDDDDRDDDRDDDNDGNRPNLSGARDDDNDDGRTFSGEPDDSERTFSSEPDDDERHFRGDPDARGGRDEGERAFGGGRDNGGARDSGHYGGGRDSGGGRDNGDDD